MSRFGDPMPATSPGRGSTAEGDRRGQGLVVVPEPRLRERAFGSFEGRTFAEIDAETPDDARRWRTREPDYTAGRPRRVAAHLP